MSTEIVKTILQELVYVVLITVVPLISKYAIQGIHAAKLAMDANTKAVKDEALAALIKKANTKVEEIVVQAVKTTNQTFVDELKGKEIFDDKARAKAFGQTYDTVKALITDETAELIQAGYGDVEVYINSKIESVVKELKIG